MPRVTSAAVGPGSWAPGPAGPSSRMCVSVASRSSCLALADARTAPTSDSQEMRARAEEDEGDRDDAAPDVVPAAPADVTETITSESRRACTMTRTAVAAPSTHGEGDEAAGAAREAQQSGIQRLHGGSS